MPNDFHKAAGNPTTTARELAIELGRFANDLKSLEVEISEEFTSMQNAKVDLYNELSLTSLNFVKNTLSQIEGNEFDTINEIARNVEELREEGLDSYRSRLIKDRDDALQNVNKALDKSFNVQDFQSYLQKAQQQYDDADNLAKTATIRLKEAKDNLKKWEDNSVEDDLVRLDNHIKKIGGISLSTDNRNYYEGNIFISMFRYIKSSSYRATRRALRNYGHGVNGKDAFSDLPSFREKYEAFNAPIEKAQLDYDNANRDKETALHVIDKVSDAAKNIKSDEQILETIQTKVVNDLISCPTFIEALAEYYEEDFPRKIPLLIAKQTTLAEITHGTNELLKNIQHDCKEVSRKYERMKQLRENQLIKVNLEQTITDNRTKTFEYKRYSRAASDSWKKTRDFEWDPGDYKRQNSENSTNYLEKLLIYNVLSEKDRHYNKIPSSNQFEANENSSFTASLVGLDRDSGAALGLPSKAFDLSKQAEEEMKELGAQSHGSEEKRNKKFGAVNNKNNNRKDFN